MFEAISLLTIEPKVRLKLYLSFFFFLSPEKPKKRTRERNRLEPWVMSRSVAIEFSSNCYVTKFNAHNMPMSAHFHFGHEIII